MRLTLKEFVAQEGINAISNVRVNTNGYPFVTVLRGSDAENVYFSKNASEKVDEGTTIKSIAKDLFVVSCTNAAGEDRIKLSFSGENYESTDSLF